MLLPGGRAWAALAHSCLYTAAYRAIHHILLKQASLPPRNRQPFRREQKKFPLLLRYDDGEDNAEWVRVQGDTILTERQAKRKFEFFTGAPPAKPRPAPAPVAAAAKSRPAPAPAPAAAEGAPADRRETPAAASGDTPAPTEASDGGGAAAAESAGAAADNAGAGAPQPEQKAAAAPPGPRPRPQARNAAMRRRPGFRLLRQWRTEDQQGVTHTLTGGGFVPFFGRLSSRATASPKQSTRPGRRRP